MSEPGSPFDKEYLTPDEKSAVKQPSERDAVKKTADSVGRDLEIAAENYTPGKPYLRITRALIVK